MIGWLDTWQTLLKVVVVAETTRVLGSDDISSIVEAQGIDKTLDELIERLRSAFIEYDADRTSTPNRDGFHYHSPALGLVEWMPTHLGQTIGVKTVGYHPSNPIDHALPTVLATTSVYDTRTGRLVALVDATLLTALRTGAASALATEALAIDGPITLGVIGCGAQAVSQIHAIERVRRIDRVLVADTDPAVAESLLRRTAFLDLPMEVVAVDRIDRMPAEVDVLCTCTSVDPGARPVVADGPHKPGLHINAVGADFPGKRELPESLVTRAVVCPDHVGQCLAEGESQCLSADRLGPELATLVKNPAVVEQYRDQLTIFDSTGWAFEDLIAAELMLDLSERFGYGSSVAIQKPDADPYDPYGVLAVR